MEFLVYKSNGDVNKVLLLPFKGTNQFSYVNITKGHICHCVFDTIEEAIKDMENRKNKGLLESYEIII